MADYCLVCNAMIKLPSFAEFTAKPQANSIQNCVLSGAVQRIIYGIYGTMFHTIGQRFIKQISSKTGRHATFLESADRI